MTLEANRYPKNGAIALAAHIISAKTHNMRFDYSMFEGFQVKGNAEKVLSRGELIVEKGKYLGRVGRGQFLRRAARGGAWV